VPIYEYECNSCRYRFELRQRFDDKPVARCPVCQGTSRRVFYPAPIIFKGSGFYVTDYRKPGPGEDGGSGEEKTLAKEGSKGTED